MTLPVLSLINGLMLEFSSALRTLWIPQSTVSKHYLISIGRIPLLTSAEEIQLGQAIQRQQACLSLKETAEAQGQSWSHVEWAAALGYTEAELVQILARGTEAKDKMVSANLRLVFDDCQKV